MKAASSPTWSQQRPARAALRRLRRLQSWLLIIAVLPLLSCPPWSAAQAEVPSEYQVKAAFIYNFAKFVEWPAESFADTSTPMRICVLGENPFGQELMRTVNGKKINGRDLLVSNFVELHLVKGCHVLFLGSSERGRIPQVLQNLRGASTLTVGETSDFAHGGGMIRFVLEGGKVRFEVNLAASEQAHLKISSKLLSLARAVLSYPGGKG